MNDCVWVKKLSGITSPTFRQKVCDDIVAIYELDNSFDLNKDSSLEEIVSALSSEMDSNPDGWLVFVDMEDQDEVRHMIEVEFLQAYRDNKLNFDNGELAEAILFYYVDTGMVIEMVDPECFSGFFKELVEQIKGMSEEALCFDLCHMSSHVCELENTDEGLKFLDTLKRNAIAYDKS